ncbi:Copper chaperone CopZ [Haladaptatus litoreus]|uniref:Copper chaperone CopZ n=1 Tax=Haladaptatus litoreus TaxID=553468 RepID=A0A1N7FC42_9EURY|nr:heavy metal-associated domain-containing protein [Haladaptatus litoreus]SIR97899.1 Copper chaperone CopZ [Haladaptatus litoreus]
MTTTLIVEGMTCGGCEQNVIDALEAVDGVSKANADREANTASVEGSAKTDALVGAVEDAGYDASA